MTAWLFLRANWKPMAILAIVAIALLGWYTTSQKLEASKAGRLADRATYKAEQAQAEATALSEKMKKEAQYAVEREKSDALAVDLGGKYHAAVLRYQATQREASRTNLPKSATPAESVDRPGGSTILPASTLMIPKEDAMICATNQARLEAAHAWALTLEMK